MSNSSRIEVATRKHVGETLNNTQIIDLVRASDPNWKGGVYPSDAAYKRTAKGLVPRGKVAYGDGVLEYLGENSFKVLGEKEIVRRPSGKKVAAKPTEPVAPATPPPATPAPAGKKAAKTTPAKPPVAPKSKAADRHVS